MAMRPLSELKDWALVEGNKDPRGKLLVDAKGYTIGTIHDILVDTERECIGAVRIESGQAYPAEPLALEKDVVRVTGRPSRGSACSAIRVRRLREETHHTDSSPNPAPPERRVRLAAGVKKAGIRALDGHIGAVHDIYFDDVAWVVRYFVVDTGTWLPGRKVLISPELFLPGDPGEDSVPVDLTREEVRNSPDASTEIPVSKQYLGTLTVYQNWLAVRPVAPAPPALPSNADQYIPRAHNRAVDKYDPHLRSMREVVGYEVEASDGSIAAIHDFCLDGGYRHIPLLLLGISSIGGSRSVAIPVKCVSGIDCAAGKLYVRISRAEMQSWSGCAGEM